MRRRGILCGIEPMTAPEHPEVLHGAVAVSAKASELPRGQIANMLGGRRESVTEDASSCNARV